MPDQRTPRPNTQDTIQDAAGGALGVFFTPSPAFLAYQRRLQHPTGHHNAQTLFGVEKTPCDNQIRTLLDPIAPSQCAPVFVEGLARLTHHYLLDSFQVFGDQLFVAMEGTTSVSSQALSCPHGLRRQRANGHTRYAPAAITPVMVCPGRAQVLALPPEPIMPQDGHEQQDCAQMAGTRWLHTHAHALAPHRVPFLGDALSSTEPFCAVALEQGDNVLLVCTPDSPPTLDERVAFWHANDGIAVWESRYGHGRFTAVARYRWRNDVRLIDGKEALAVHGLESTVSNVKTGALLSHKSVVTNHRVTADHVAAVAQAGRGRWKIAHAHNNVLKTKGDHVAHNFGHGKHFLAAVLLRLNLLAFLCHTVLEWSDDQYALLRRVLARRQTFFTAIQAFMRYAVFDSWDHLMECMLQDLALQPSLDTS